MAEDLRDEIYQIKKELQATLAQNTLLKVKVCKLRDELNKKNKQMDNLLDPKKNTSVQKIISERGVTLILNLRKQNDKLERTLNSKDMVIKKLQADIQTMRLYTVKDKFYSNQSTPLLKNFDHDITTKYFNREFCDNKHSEFYLSEFTTPRGLPYAQDNQAYTKDLLQLNKNVERIRSVQNSAKDETQLLTKNDFIKFISQMKNVNQHACGSQMDTNVVLRYFTDMLSEINNLKEIVSQVSVDQEKALEIFNRKNEDIEILSKQMRLLTKKESVRDKRRIKSKLTRNKKPDSPIINQSLETVTRKEKITNLPINKVHEKGDTSDTEKSGKSDAESYSKSFVYSKTNCETSQGSTFDELNSTDDDADVETESEKNKLST